MSCNHPLKAFWTGSFTESGKLDLYIAPESAGDTVSAALVEKKGHHVGPAAPLTLQNGQPYLTDPLLIPCGHCIGCRMQIAKQWQIRLCHEAEHFKDRCWFVTLTYRDASLPFSKFDGTPTLIKTAIADFMKRLRTYTGRKFRYFGCGEYGTDPRCSHRPHYHLILFGDFDDLVPYKFGCFHSSVIAKAWPYGLHDVQAAEANSMAYVAGYVEKKQNDPCWDEYPVKPFLAMSKRPALGSGYVPRISGRDNHVYGSFGKSHYASVPRAYLKKLEGEPWFEDYKKRCLDSAKKSRLLDQAVYGSTDETLIGFAKDEAAYRSLEKVRIEKL